MPSQHYEEALRRTQAHHAGQNKTFSGRFTWKQRHRIKALIDRFGVTSILDYGCGKGRQYEERDPETGQGLVDYWGVEPVKFDPGTREFAAEPAGTFDLVICVQVLGSIPVPDLPWVIDRLYGHAKRAVFVAERLKMPRKMIFDGMNDVMPFGQTVEQWTARLARPGSPVRMVAAFHKQDPVEGWPGWKMVEPEGQGA